MKRHIATAMIGLGFWGLAGASPITPLYQNTGTVTEIPTVDAIVFDNSGDFDLSTVLNVSTFSQSGFSSELTPIPFETRDTKYFTNTGVMLGIPGFQLDTSKGSTRVKAADIINQGGSVTGEDTPAGIILYSPPGSTASIPWVVDNQPIASQVLLYGTNVVNSGGSFGVGQYGLLKIVSKTFTNTYSSLVAGAVDTGNGFFNEDNLMDTTAQGNESANAYYINPPYVYDLLWGATNGGILNLSTALEFDPPNVSTPPIAAIFRDGGTNGSETLPLNFDAQWAVYVETNTVSGTNIYYNVVFVNTNFADTNLNADVRFGPYELPSSADVGDTHAKGDIVEFFLTTPDVITGDIVTNAVYLLDAGAAATNEVLLDNAASVDNFNRPDTFEISTATPIDWELGVTSNAVYQPSLLYNSFEFGVFQVPYFAAIYGVQIGRDPETLDGNFANTVSLLNLSSLSSISGSFFAGGVSLPDPTNEAARIEVTAGQADLTATRLRAEGMLIVDITNLLLAGSGAYDWGQANLAVGMTNGSLSISNFVPTSFQRVRGDIYAWSATWQNIFTNAIATNSYHYHVLVVDQNLRGNFQPTIRNLTLRGTNSIALSDNLRVINQTTFETTNLIIDGAVQLTQNAGNFVGSNAPNLKALFIDTNGSLSIDSTLDIGYNLAIGQTAPGKRKYVVSSVTNFGAITATAVLLQANSFENDGTIFTTDFGSVLVDANKIGFGLSLTNATNSIFADGDITLSAATIEVTNSVIFSGLGKAGTLTLDATKELTDFVPVTTGTNNVIHNFWTVTGGFTLPVKPAAGDLFGTEITTMASSNSYVTHVWAGLDEGPSTNGFLNNVVIGHLTLAAGTNAVLHFTGAGSDNGLYVDYLELAPNTASYNQYRQALQIDPNLTIYFADSNVDPLKLEEAFSNRLVWVQDFATPGPETTERLFVVPNTSSSPGSGSNANASVITFSRTGDGSVSVTPPIKPHQLPAIGRPYTLTATPSAGWAFSGWTAEGLTVANTNSSVLKFTLPPNVSIDLIANFTPKLFTLQKGTYNGLFYDAGAVTPSSSGFFTLTLQGSGVFSGRLLMGPSTYHFSSKLGADGVADGVVAKSGKNSLTVDLRLDVTNATGKISGDVGNGTWDALLDGDLAPVWTTKAPLAGTYAMVLPWETGVTPGGDSYGAIKITRAGILSVTGALSDGTGFGQTVAVSGDGRWPFYAYAPAGRDTVLGWVQFTNGAPEGTNISWSKGAGEGRYYPNGFTNSLNLWGSSNDVSLDLVAPVIILSGGDLPESLTNAVEFKGGGIYGGADITLKINPAGTFSGHFVNTNTGLRTFSGAVLQNSARGFFLGTDEGGAVLLKSASGGQ